MKYFIKEDLKNWTLLFVTLYLAFNAIPVLVGLKDGLRGRRGNCDSYWARVEYVFVGYRVGCWLGQPVGFKGYGEE